MSGRVTRGQTRLRIDVPPAGAAAAARRLEQPDRARSGAWIALAYGALGALGVILAEAVGRSPWITSPWAGDGGALALVTSLALGGLLAAATIRATRLVGGTRWARALHADLRPVVFGLGDGAIATMAVASGLGEELFFRGFLTPVAGVLVSSAAFGALHQVRGKARWAWTAWAALMGLIFAVLFDLTGHLAGPILAHATINFVNLRYLRDNNPEPKPRALGGLLAR